MTDLRNVPDELLEAELARRKAKANEPTGAIEPPTPLGTPYWGRLIEYCLSGIDEAARVGYIDKNFDHWVYEAALEAVFGPEIWTWIRTLPGGR